MKEWEIRQKVVCLVTDNAANMVKTARLLNITHLPCFAHSLNLVAKSVFRKDDLQRPATEDMDAIDKSNELIITPFKDLVTHFHSSAKSNRLLNSLKKQDENPPAGLKQQIEVRWNTTFYMVKSVMENLKYIKIVNCEHELGLNIPKADSVKLANDICKIFAPFEEITCKISGAKYVTSSLILPMTRALITALSASNEKMETHYGQLLLQRAIRLSKDRLVQQYEGRKLLKLSTLLDPRVKTKGFFYQQNCADAITLLKGTLAEKLKAQIQITNSDESLSTPSHSQLSSKKKPSMFDFLDEDQDDEVSSNHSTNITACNAEKIVRNYLERKRINFEKDPLTTYWRDNDQQKLTEIALECLCVPGLSVPVERLFSSTGYLVTDRRNRLSPQHVQMMSFLHQNYVFYNEK